MSPKQRRDRLGKPIKSRSQYASMIFTALVLSIVFIALAVGAYWVSEKYYLSRQIQLPAALAQRLPPETMTFCVPLGLAAAVFIIVQGFIATLISRFQGKSKDDVDEDGLYKRDY